jgi:hypothetical protein
MSENNIPGRTPAGGRVNIGFVLKDVSNVLQETKGIDLVMRADQLSLLKQAAKNSGFMVGVLATEGHKYTKIGELSERELQMGKKYTEILEEGMNHIIISKNPPDVGDFSKFWNEYRELRIAQNSVAPK